MIVFLILLRRVNVVRSTIVNSVYLLKTYSEYAYLHRPPIVSDWDDTWWAPKAALRLRGAVCFGGNER